MGKKWYEQRWFVVSVTVLAIGLILGFLWKYPLVPVPVPYSDNSAAFDKLVKETFVSLEKIEARLAAIETDTLRIRKTIEQSVVEREEATNAILDAGCIDDIDRWVYGEPMSCPGPAPCRAP